MRRRALLRSKHLLVIGTLLDMNYQTGYLEDAWVISNWPEGFTLTRDQLQSFCYEGINLPLELKFSARTPKMFMYNVEGAYGINNESWEEIKRTYGIKEE